jgi:hypothetical protein
MMTHMEAQGLTTADLRHRASEVLSHLSEDQLLVVLAFARSLAGEHAVAKDHVLEDLLEDLH